MAELTPEDVLERLFLRLAHIDTDDKLQTFVDKTLMTVLDLLATDNQDVIAKGNEILTYLIRRLKTEENVKVNVDSYLAYLLRQTHPIPLGLAMPYFKMGVRKLSEAEFLQYLPDLLKLFKSKIDQKSTNITNELNFVILKGIAILGKTKTEKWPTVIEHFRDASVKPLILQLLKDVMAYQYTNPEKSKFMAQGILQGSCPDSECGLTLGAYADITFKLIVAGENMTEMKVGILNFLNKDVYTEAEAFPIYAMGKSNLADKVKAAAELQLRKVNIDDCVADPTVVNQLFLWYLGRESQDLKQRIGIADIPLKMAMMPFLVRSKKAAISFPGCYKVAFGALAQDPSALRPMKVQMLGAQFLQSIVESLPPNFLPNFGPIIFKQLTKIIDNCEHCNVVAVLYRSYGILGRKLPKLVTSNLTILNDTFEATASAPEDVIGAVQDCLVEWLPSFAAVKDPAMINMLETVVAQFVKVEKCSLVALKYIASLIKSKSPVFRWLLVHCFNTRRHDLEKEASRLLQLSIADNEFLPDFAELVDLFHKNLKIQTVTEELELAETKKIDPHKSKLTEKTYQIATTYLLAAAAANAKCSGKFFGFLGDDLKMEELPKIAAFLKSVDKDTVTKFVEIVLTTIWESTNIDSALLHICIFVLSCSRGTPNTYLVQCCREKLRTVAKSSNRYAVCNFSAHAFILLLAPETIEAEFTSAVSELAENKDFVPGVAWIVALFSLCPQVSYENAAQVQKTLLKMIENGVDQPNIVLESALSALAEILRMSCVGDEKKHLHIQQNRTSEEYKTVIDLLAKVVVSRKDTINMKMKESAAAALGYLSSVHESMDADTVAKTVESLFAVGEGPPLPELQFNVGDALFDSVCGELSDARRNVYLTTPQERKFTSTNPQIEERARKIISTIISGKVNHTNRHLRQAALIWLYRMTKRGSDMGLQVISEHLDSIQAAFINGLAEANEFAQDVASKGVGLAYSLATDEMKKKLVEQLVESLSTGRKPTVKVTADTVLFEKGQLGAAPTGEGISTYKEICALATDMNQPDLVYKFLSLASHNATWNSKKGAAFGFGAVFEVAKNELQPYLGTLVPKLYRYTYDPDGNVQMAMKSIWKEVTGTQKNVIDEYSVPIMKEIRSSLLNREWRVRESSCLALGDLLAGHFNKEMCADLGELMADLFRVQDDVKESVRVAAQRALKQVEKTIYKYGAEGLTTANAVISIALPVLVEKGIYSTVKATRMFGLRCIMRLGKEAGKSLKPFLKDVVKCLLQALSETEPSVLNYLAVRANDDEREMLDDARSSAARTSPMMSSLNDSIPLIDEENYPEIAVVLYENLKNSVGLTSRTGAAQLLVNICLRLPNMMNTCKSSNVKIFNALLTGLNDRNPAVRKQFSSTISYLLKYCPEAQIKKLVNFVVESLTSTEDEKRQTAYHLLRALVNQCHELVTDFNAQILPVVFLTTFEKVPKGDPAAKQKHDLWLELWNEMIPGTDSAIRLYSSEMIALAFDLMRNNPAYNVRSNSAAMLSRIFQSAASSFSVERADEIYSTLMEFLPGKLWLGKETVLNAVESLVSKASVQLKQKWTSEVMDQKFAPLFKETQKRNVEYKAQAIKAAVTFCQSLTFVEGAGKMETFISELIARKDEENDSDDDDEESKHQKITQQQDFLAILAEWLARLLTVYTEESRITPGVTILMNLMQDSSVYWKAKHATVTGLQAFIDQHKFDHSFDATPLLISVATVLKTSVLQRKNFANDTCAVIRALIVLSKNNDNVTLCVEDAKNILGEIVLVGEMKASPICEDTVRDLLNGYGEPMN